MLLSKHEDPEIDCSMLALWLTRMKSECLLLLSELKFATLNDHPRPNPSSGLIKSLKSCSTAERDMLLSSRLGRLLVPKRRFRESREDLILHRSV